MAILHLLLPQSSNDYRGFVGKTEARVDPGSVQLYSEVARMPEAELHGKTTFRTKKGVPVCNSIYTKS